MYQPSKSEQEAQMNTIDLDAIINLDIPHIGEKIFENLETDDLIQCLKVSSTWKILAEKILLARWEGKLLEACREGKTEIVEILLEKIEDADEVTAVDVKGKTALIMACEHGHTDLVKLLLDHPKSQNIDINAEGKFVTARMTCLVLGCDCEGTALDEEGKTALILACEHGHKDVVKLLLDHPRSENIDINAKYFFGCTALIIACWTGHKDVVKLL